MMRVHSSGSNQRVLGSLLSVVLVVGLGAGQASAGLKITLSGDAETDVVLVQGSSMQLSGGSDTTSADCKSGLLTTWNAGAGAYWQGTPDALVSDATAYIAKKFGGLSAEDKAALGIGSAPGPARVMELGTRTIAGYQAVGYQVGAGAAQPVIDVWFSNDLERRVERESGTCDALEGTLAAAPALLSGPSMVSAIRALQQQHGFPVSEATVDGGQATTLIQLAKVEDVNIPASTFAVPPGYKQVSTYGDFLKAEDF